jgi:hypothetical protein
MINLKGCERKRPWPNLRHLEFSRKEVKRTVKKSVGNFNIPAEILNRHLSLKGHTI